MTSTGKRGSKGSFKQRLGTAELKFFNELATKTFSEQAVSFLNAYWAEVGSQADFIFQVSWEFFKSTDMHYKGVDYIHLYDEGINLDFDAALYFFEKLSQHCDEDSKDPMVCDETKISHPTMMTSITRKKELRNKVDVNFDGRVSFIEYLLYQYEGCGCNPEDFCEKAMAAPDESKELREAREALEAVNARIRAYEAEKARLEALAKKPGVKGLGAKNLLAQLASSPLAEELGVALITAEAKVRAVQRKYGGKRTATTGGTSTKPTRGAVWWLKKDLKQKKSKYGKKKK